MLRLVLIYPAIWYTIKPSKQNGEQHERRIWQRFYHHRGVDDDGTEFELEVLDTMDYKGQTFVAFLPADMDENDPDYGIVILRSVLDENGDELFESIDDDDELQDVYEHFSRILFDDEEE